MMTSWHTIVGNSETLSAADLDSVGGHATGKITDVSGARFEEDGETGAPKKVDKKALISFEGKSKKFAANTINCLLIEQMWGEDIEGWIGHRLTLVSDKVEVRGKFYGDPCVRVKGSPELAKTLTVKIQLPRRKPFNRMLVPTAQNAPQTAPAPSEASEPHTDPHDGTDAAEDEEFEF